MSRGPGQEPGRVSRGHLGLPPVSRSAPWRGAQATRVPGHSQALAVRQQVWLPRTPWPQAPALPVSPRLPRNPSNLALHTSWTPETCPGLLLTAQVLSSPAGQTTLLPRKWSQAGHLQWAAPGLSRAPHCGHPQAPAAPRVSKGREKGGRPCGAAEQPGLAWTPHERRRGFPLDPRCLCLLQAQTCPGHSPNFCGSLARRGPPWGAARGPRSRVCVGRDGGCSETVKGQESGSWGQGQVAGRWGTGNRRARAAPKNPGVGCSSRGSHGQPGAQAPLCQRSPSAPRCVGISGIHTHSLADTTSNSPWGDGEVKLLNCFAGPSLPVPGLPVSFSPHRQRHCDLHVPT